MKMIYREVLEEAIKKAVDGGWQKLGKYRIAGMPLKAHKEHCKFPVIENGMAYNQEVDHYRYIFSHEFAKALWGEEDTTDELFAKRKYPMGTGGCNGDKNDWHEGTVWQYHLQQMVLAEDPIKYLKENI